MSIAQALAGAAVKVIETRTESVRLYWKIRRYNSSDLAGQGLAAFAAIPQHVLMEIARVNAVDDPADREQAAAEMLEKHGPRLQGVVDKTKHLEDAAVCAAVTEASADGEDWEPIKLVRQPHQASPDAGKVWIGDLPEGIRGQLLKAVQQHQGEDGELAERLASFRGEPRHAADAGQDREAVRSDAA